jgi:mRNA export factor
MLFNNVYSTSFVEASILIIKKTQQKFIINNNNNNEMTSTQPIPSPNNYPVPNPPPSISSVTWGTSPNADLLACTSWNCGVYLYNVARTGQTTAQFQPVTTYNHNTPTLSCCVNSQNQLWSGSCDGEIKVWQQGKEATKIGAHDNGVKCIEFIEQRALGISGGWDKTIKYWDLRQPNALALSVPVPDRVYAMSISGSIVTVALANKKIAFYDLTNPQNALKVDDSMLKYQVRCIATFPTQNPAQMCYAIGSIEGRVGIQYVQEDIPNGRKNFAFKCHRDPTNNAVYPINAISVHPTFGTFSTAGGDGVFHFWDKDVKQRLQQFTRAHPTLPIVDTAFNKTGEMFAYACAYDWAKGHEYATEDSALLIHFPTEKEVRKKT